MELQREEGYDVDTSCEEYLLIQTYCTRRSSQKTTTHLRGQGPLPPQTPGLPLLYPQGRGYHGGITGGITGGVMGVAIGGAVGGVIGGAVGGVIGLSQPSSHDEVTEKKNIQSGPKVTIFRKKTVVQQPLASDGDIQPGAADDGSDLTGVTDRLAQIADGVQIGEASRLEADSPESPEDVIQKLVELLKSSGDQLNEEIQRNQAMQTYLQNTFTYALFEQVTSRLQEVVSGGRAGRAAEPQDGLERQQIAVAFEVTSRLSAVDVLPMSRAMGYGTRYVQIHHSSWVRQQGGWKKAFESEDID